MGAIGRLGQFYKTQIVLLWHWRLGRWALVKRAIVALVAGVIAFNITAWLLPGLLQITEIGGGLAAVIFISLLNLIVRPAILALVANRSVVALVILTLVFQAIVILLLDPFVGAVTVTTGVIGALIISFVFGGIAGAIGLLFGLNEDDSYYGALARTLASRHPDVTTTSEPGIVIIQLDGLSHDVISHSLRAGRVPTMAGWIRDGTHRLGHWDALLPSTTPASQAGILHGNNDGIPNFRWWEKKTGQLLVANHPEDATVIEQRISNGEGLLSPGGASISNIFTGDADRALPGDVHHQGQGARSGRQRRLRVVLRQPLQLHHDDREIPRRDHQGERPVAPPGPRWHRAPDASWLPLPGRPCRHERRTPGPGHLAHHPGDGPGHARHLHGLHRLRRDRAPQRTRAARNRSTPSTASTGSSRRC